MKFGKKLLNLMIPEWKDKYIDYNKLKNILKKASKITKKKYLVQYDRLIANNINQNDKKILENLHVKFFVIFYSEFDKFTHAFLFIYYEMIYPNFVKLIVNFDILKNNASRIKQKEYIKSNIKLKNSIERFYKLIIYTNEFINLNLRIIYKISKKFKKIYKIVGLFKQSQMVEFNDYVCSKYCRKEISEMKEIKNKTKNLYYKKYFV